MLFSSQFLEDVTVPDGEHVAPGAQLLKIWRMRNNGARDWPAGVQLVHRSGDRFGTPADGVAATIQESVPRGADVDVVAELRMPEAPSPLVGASHCKGHFQLRLPGARDSYFGHSVWIEVWVDPAITAPAREPAVHPLLGQPLQAEASASPARSPLFAAPTPSHTQRQQQQQQEQLNQLQREYERQQREQQEQLQRDQERQRLEQERQSREQEAQLQREHERQRLERQTQQQQEQQRLQQLQREQHTQQWLDQQRQQQEQHHQHHQPQHRQHPQAQEEAAAVSRRLADLEQSVSTLVGQLTGLMQENSNLRCQLALQQQQQQQQQQQAQPSRLELMALSRLLSPEIIERSAREIVAAIAGESIDLQATKCAAYRVHERLGRRTSTASSHTHFYGVNSAVFRVSLSRQQETDRGRVANSGTTTTATPTTPTTSTEFALKVLFTFVGAEQETHSLAGMYRREFAVLSDPVRLPPHPNVIRVLHHFVDRLEAGFLPDWSLEAGLEAEKTLFLVMPLLGTSLHSVISKRQIRRADQAPFFTAREFCLLALQLARALRHINEHQIVHRDVKPDNALVSCQPSSLATSAQEVDESSVEVDNMRVVLCDFGEHLDLRAEQCVGFNMPYPVSYLSKGGASAFFSPEVLDAQPGPGAVVDYSGQDAWALGLVLWEMLMPLSNLWSVARSKAAESAGSPGGGVFEQLPECYDVRIRRLVSQLLVLDKHRRATLPEVVESIEAILWGPGGVDQGPESSGGATGSTEAAIERHVRHLKTATAAKVLAAGDAAASTSMRDAMLLDWLASPRSAPQVVARALERVS